MIKRVVIVLLIVLTSFTVFALYRTLAYDTSVVENTPSTTDLDYTFQIGNSSIKQLVVEPNETRYYDVVMYNPNPAKISYVIYYEMVSPSSKPEEFSIVYKKRSKDKSSGIANKESSITLTIEVSNTSSSEVKVNLGPLAGYVNGGDLPLEDGQVLIPEEVIPPAYKFIEKLDDGSNGDSGSGVYKVHHDEISATDSVTGEVIPAVDDYRYYGADPNNYVCLDFEGSTTCPNKHLYRIIGSIYDELEGTNRLKLIKATILTDDTVPFFAWDMKSDGTFLYIWAKETETRNNITNNYSNSTTSGSSLMIMLNSGIWWSDTTNIGKTYYYRSNPSDVDFTNYKLSGIAKSIIGDSRYYLVGYDTSEITTTAMYTYERTNKDTSAPYYWEGKVALMYPSDYGYAAGNTCANGTNLRNYDTICKNNDWLLNGSTHQWLLSRLSESPFHAFAVTNEGVTAAYVVGGFGVVRPVFYLKQEVIITGGTGTIDSPYTLSL